jgi:hypothetical protein
MFKGLLQIVFVSKDHCSGGCILGDVIGAPIVFFKGKNLYLSNVKEVEKMRFTINDLEIVDMVLGTGNDNIFAIMFNEETILRFNLLKKDEEDKHIFVGELEAFQFKNKETAIHLASNIRNMSALDLM